MSDDRWIKSLLGGLVILIFGIASSKGNFDECSLCCTLHGPREDLNCTWMNDSSLQLSVLLQSITNPHDFPQHYAIQPGQKWLLIHRKNLTLYHKYHLSVNGGTWMETLNLTYCHGCENVFIGAPELHPSFYDDEDETLVVGVTWKHKKEYSRPPVVELRYRILGDSGWILVHSNDLEPDCYHLNDPEPYTDYEFQIRYVPDEMQKSRGLWSDIVVVRTPEEVPIGAPDIWRRMDQENSTLVTWKTLSRHSARGRILTYYVTYIYNNTRQTTEEPCCNVTLPAPSTHVCVSARNSMGLGPHSCISPLCSVAPVMGDLSGKAWGDPSGSIAVWRNESMTYGFPVHYLVEWRKDNSSEMDWVRSEAANQTLVLPGKFSPGILYNISIHALYNDSCVMVFSTEAYGQEEVPLEAPIYSIRELSLTKVFISWNKIPKHTMRGKLKHYTIYINSTTSSEWHTVHGRNMTLSSLSPQTCYDIYITASTAAGEGVPSASHRFCTKEGMRNLHPLVKPLVLLTVVCVLILVLLKNRVDLWPKIPKPEDKFNGTTISTKFWELQQTLPNPPITEVEEVEPMSPPSPSPPQPDRSRAISSGYEKHFMPTPEEVMRLC